MFCLRNSSSRFITLIRSSGQLWSSIRMNVRMSHSFVANDNSDLDIMKIFEQTKPFITNEMKNEINAKILVQISGENFLLDFRSKKPLQMNQIDRKIPENIDLILLLPDSKILQRIIKGELRTSIAYLAGKLKIRGDKHVAFRMKKLFNTLKSSSF
ncbi:uncharacterized protein LOC113791710 [Dermatophagoides pteronyssinus]|uniref:Hydroxysteroid dehydrogenase-like protein 2 n=1 Tax=Dermatophagoides pteronyssinus TaxID=6956 RepID=A0ABQ8JL53_DERPT|nr:Hydroxysteroid dehydrogenase-like protein 2 [Dermatophagoides pteronyssinus]